MPKLIDWLDRKVDTFNSARAAYVWLAIISLAIAVDMLDDGKGFIRHPVELLLPASLWGGLWLIAAICAGVATVRPRSVWSTVALGFGCGMLLFRGASMLIGALLPDFPTDTAVSALFNLGTAFGVWTAANAAIMGTGCPRAARREEHAHDS